MFSIQEMSFICLVNFCLTFNSWPLRLLLPIFSTCSLLGSGHIQVLFINCFITQGENLFFTNNILNNWGTRSGWSLGDNWLCFDSIQIFFWREYTPVIWFSTTWLLWFRGFFWLIEWGVCSLFLLWYTLDRMLESTDIVIFLFCASSCDLIRVCYVIYPWGMIG